MSNGFQSALIEAVVNQLNETRDSWDGHGSVTENDIVNIYCPAMSPSVQIFLRDGRRFTVSSSWIFGEVLRAALVVQSCCNGGPQWGHEWDCPNSP